MGLGFFQGILAGPVLIAILFAAVNFTTQVKYKVHLPSSSAVILTGASTGIGRHAAEELARMGFDVYASVRSEKDEAELRGLGIPSLIPFQLDVANPNSRIAAVENVVKQVEASRKVLMGLVNNAGIGGGLPAELHSVQDAKAMFEVNFFGMMHLTQLCLPSLRANQGRVVQVSSLAGRLATRARAVYAGTKFAMEGFSDALRLELTPYNVSVSIVEPGFVKSAISINGVQRIKAQTEEEKRAQELYPLVYPPGWDEKYKQIIANGDEPSVTTNAIIDALTNPFPATRYPVAKVCDNNNNRNNNNKQTKQGLEQ